MLMRGADKISDCAHGLWMESVCLSASLPVISDTGGRFYPTGHALAAKQLAKMLKPKRLDGSTCGVVQTRRLHKGEQER